MEGSIIYDIILLFFAVFRYYRRCFHLEPLPGADPLTWFCHSLRTPGWWPRRALAHHLSAVSVTRSFPRAHAAVGAQVTESVSINYESVFRCWSSFFVVSVKNSAWFLLTIFSGDKWRRALGSSKPLQVFIRWTVSLFSKLEISSSSSASPTVTTERYQR